MNGLELVGVLSCVIFATIAVWVLGYFIFMDNIDSHQGVLGASILTIMLLVIALIITMASYIESDRKNKEYKKVVSEYEESEAADDK